MKTEKVRWDVGRGWGCRLGCEAGAVLAEKIWGLAPCHGERGSASLSRGYLPGTYQVRLHLVTGLDHIQEHKMFSLGIVQP